jgi:GNAT superfamily N-acetyltransferase
VCGTQNRHRIYCLFQPLGVFLFETGIMNRKQSRKMKAWLVTWKWFGEHAKRDDVVAAIFDPRFSGERVRQFVEFLYLTENSTLSERMSWARDKKRNPYPARFMTLDGVPWHGEVHCGHNPFLFARLVDDLTVERVEGGKEKATWKERPKPDIMWNLRMKDLRVAETPKIEDDGNYDVKELSPGDLTATNFAVCVAVIKKGEAVDWKWAARELPLAVALAIAYKGAQIVGVGAVKRVRRKYATEVSSKSGVDFPPETLELGYVAVDPDHRRHGLSHRIVKALLSQYAGRLFATTYNDHMKKTLENAGFVRKGKEWKGRRFMLSFWDKE